MKNYFFVLLVLITTLVFSQENKDTQAILAVMKAQEKAWSNNDLEGFMQGYWKNDSLAFFGSRGVTYGWQPTLENYKKGYPTKEDTGVLSFYAEAITPIAEDTYYVMGRYFLKRNKGDAEGVFMIIFKKIKGQWKIVADMSC